MRVFTLMDSLRKCRFCSLEAHTTEDLKLFRSTSHGKYGYANVCKKCYYERWGRPYNRRHYYKYLPNRIEWRKTHPEKIKELGRRRRERARERYGSDPEYHKKMLEKSRNYQRNRYGKLRESVIRKFGGKCVHCGCDISEALEFNHINGHGRKDQRRKNQFYLELINDKRKDVELTCKVCNAVHALKLKGITGYTISWSPK